LIPQTLASLNPSLRYAAVLFDLDGTLINSAQDLVESVQYALSAIDPRPVPDHEDILVQVGKPLEVILRELGYPAGDEAARRFVQTYRDHFARHFTDHTVLYPHVEETLTALKQAGARLALVTAKHQAQADLTVRGCGLARFFDYVHGWQEGREHKPHPEPVLTALHHLGAGPAAALMVGDSEQDVLAARAAGVDTCAVSYGFRPVIMLRALRPDYLISRITDLLPIVLDSNIPG
jgi:2-phosphoglycolate phosphatase